MDENDSPLEVDVLVKIEVKDSNSQHDYYSSQAMDKFSVNFTRSLIDRVILSNRNNNVQDESRIIIHNSSRVVMQSPTIVFDPCDGVTLYNIDFCLRSCLHLDDEDTRQDVVRLLQAYILENPRPSALEVSIDKIDEYICPLYDNHEQKDHQLSNSKCLRARFSNIGRLKKISVRDVGLEDGEENCCSICLGNIADEQQDVSLTRMPCNHDFHDDCILKWLKISPYCPICRFQLGKAVSGHLIGPSSFAMETE